VTNKKKDKMPHPHQLKKKVYYNSLLVCYVVFLLQLTQWHNQYLNYAALVMAEWIWVYGTGVWK